MTVNSELVGKTVKRFVFADSEARGDDNFMIEFTDGTKLIWAYSNCEGTTWFNDNELDGWSGGR